MKKALASILALLMLVTMLPLTGMVTVSAAATNLVTNGDFEGGNADGWTVWQGTEVSKAAAHSGSYGAHLKGEGTWGGMLDQAVTVKAGTAYKVNMWLKAVSNGVNIQIKDGSAEGAVLGSGWANSTSWTEMTWLVTPATNALFINFCGGGNGNAESVYVDDITVTESVVEVVNGDFSDNSGWKLGTGATIANGMLTLKNIGAWSEAAMQTVPVKANTSYEISWKSQYVSGSGTTNMTLMNTGFANIPLTSGQSWMNSNDKNWINHSVTLNTGNATAIVFKLTSESGGTKTINIDDVKIIEIKDPAFDGYIYNGDFETGRLSPWDNLWNSNTVDIVKGGHSGSYALKVVSGEYKHVRQKVTVKANTDYIVQAWAKSSTETALLVKDGNDSANLAQEGLNSSSDWGMSSVVFNSGSNTSVYVGFMGNTANAAYTVDDIVMFEKKPASNDGFVINGDFETATLEGYQVYQNTFISAAAKKDGSYGVNLKGDGGWGALLEQTTQSLKKGYKYTVSFWYKANSSGSNFTVKQNGNELTAIDGENKVSAWINATEWTQVSIDFIAPAAGAALINFCGGGDGNAEDIYVDNIKIVEQKVCAHTYDNACDATCNLCGETRQVGSHTWKNGSCSACGAASPSKPVITVQPVQAYAKMGEVVKVSLTATGEGLTYKWYVKNAGADKYVVSSSTTNVYSARMSDTVKDRRVLCKVYDKYGNMVQSKSVLLKEYITLNIISQPKTGYAKMGEKVSVSVKAEGIGLRYVWYYKNAGASSYKKSSVTKSTYTTTLNEKSIGRRVYCRVYDQEGNLVKSSSAVLTEKLDLVILTQPKRAYAAMGKKATVTVKARGNGLTYTWYVKNSGGKKYSKSSVTKNTYSVTMSEKVDQRLVYCVIKDAHGNTVRTETVRLVAK